MQERVIQTHLFYLREKIDELQGRVNGLYGLLIVAIGVEVVRAALSFVPAVVAGR